MKVSFSGIIFGLICICIGCFFLAGTWGSYLDYNRLKEYNGRAIGHIAKKHFQIMSVSKRKQKVIYMFSLLH